MNEGFMATLLSILTIIGFFVYFIKEAYNNTLVIF
jgi:hypothetical protein